MRVDMARLAHLERGIENIDLERCRPLIGSQSIVETTTRVKRVPEGEVRFRIFGVDRDRPVERALGPVEVSLRVVDQADLKHGAGMIGAKLGGTLIGRGGAIQITLPAQRVTEVEMRLRFGRIDPDRAAICGDRPVDMTGYLERIAKIVVCARIAFVERDGAPQQRDRPSGLVELERDHGAGLQRIPVIGACGENLAIERLRIGEPPGSPIEGGPAQCFTDAGR